MGGSLQTSHRATAPHEPQHEADGAAAGDRVPLLSIAATPGVPARYVHFLCAALFGSLLTLFFVNDAGLFTGSRRSQTDRMRTGSKIRKLSDPVIHTAGHAEDAKDAPCTSQHALWTPNAAFLVPYYVQCFQNPTFSIGDNAPEGCPLLDSGEFRAAASVVVDASRCQHFLSIMQLDPHDAPDRAADARADVDAQEAMVVISLEPRVVQLRLNSTDHDVFRQDFHFLARLAPYISTSGSTFLDAGANIGLASILFAQMMRGRGEVLALEAHPGTMAVARKNLEGLAASVTPVLAALVSHPAAEANATMRFSGAPSDFWGFRVDHDDATASATPRDINDHHHDVVFDVETTTLTRLKALTRTQHIDFIKLDIEGEERELLSDPASAVVLCEATCIIMELHDRFVPGCTAAFEAFLAAGCARLEGEKSQEDEESRVFFETVVQTGEYIVVCAEDAASR